MARISGCKMIDAKTIKYIAKLSRIEMDDSHVEKYSKDLSNILDYFAQISKIDTLGVEPMTTPVEYEIRWREDHVVKEYSPEEMLKNAPEKSGNLFKVPPVV